MRITDSRAAAAKPDGSQAGGSIQARLALTLKTFVLIVTFAAATDLIGSARTERIANFDDYQACVSAGQALYSQQRWECVPQNQHPKDAPANR
jgi:hypothetical protein